ncbi:GGDEF domain-containing response regulator [Kordiimonas laminariae]|uniref:GGDEF domain-containing response regulator n=1 Tax=Kordiimonas laminariae TaxID=2917717 RepID=UPI001FF35352|nr:diguanylate cyclase [Kordiimonas laminariae]
MPVTPAKRILLVEDSKFYAAVMQQQLTSLENVEVDHVVTYAETKAKLADGSTSYDLALVDLNLPDATQGESVDFTIQHDIPTIVFSGQYDSDLKSRLFQKGILDYVVKDSPVAVNYLLDVVTNFLSPNKHKILIANANKRERQKQIQTLTALKMSVWVCDSIKETEQVLEKQDDINLVLAGEELSDGSGIQLVTALRKQFDFAKVAILTILDEHTNNAAQYLRYGANDFLRTPFSPEEFQCRLASLFKIQDQIKTLEYAATRDFLTGMLNRRAFFESAEPMLALSNRENNSLALAIIDIDFFKKINDTYGHDIGDVALKEMAQALEGIIRKSDVAARFGGEEFCLLLPNLTKEAAPEFFLRLQAAIKSIAIETEQGVVSFTASFGVCFERSLSIDDMIKKADEALYQAKENGRDQYIIAS